MSREGAMITKLKEGLQEALVFLRQLGDFKIPAVMERRRKGLLDKLVELQGDTFRGDSTPKDSNRPSPEPSTAKVKSPEPEKKEEESPVRSTVTSPSRDSVTSPSKRLSRGDSKISSLVGNYEHITTLAKKEEEAETPKRFVQLKKVTKPSDFPDTEKDKEEEPPEEEEKDELKPATPKEVEKVGEKTSLTPQPSPQMRRKGKENGGLKTERPSSTVSEESANNEAAEEEAEEQDGAGGEKESSKKKGKFKGFKKLGGKLKKKPKSGRDKSPSRPVEDEEEKSGASEAEEGDHKEEGGSSPEHEEGVKISGMLEKKVSGRFKSTKWVKVSVKLKDNVLYIGDKDKVDLAGYMVAASDVGFDVIDHATQKQIQFKTEEGENGKERWIEALNAAIEECNPEQEEPPAAEEPAPTDSSIEVPSITIEQPPSSSPAADPQTPTHADTPTLKKKKEKAALGVSKPAKKLPDQGVEMKGYMYRKKPGLGNRWEKAYCVVTYQAMYFTTMQDNTEYNHMLSLMGDAQKTLSEKKGHDKNSKGINLKLGSKKEQLSFDSSEFDQWKSALEKVLGIGGVEELLSEDEDIEDDIGGEELYEELETDDLPPPIPSSPRPSNTPVPGEQPDDIIIDEDIYEDTDDYRQDFNNIQESPVHTAPPPALPDRNPPKMNAPALPDRNPPKATTPAPTLPPRNAPPTKNSGPSLPPRGAKQEPQQYEQAPPARPPSKLPAKAPAKAPAKVPTPAPDVGDEEIYDDVIPGGDDQDAEIEETYDDVIVGENDVMEETYDDVVSATTSAPGQQTKEPEPITEEFYEDMVPGGPGDGPQEDYVVMEPGEDIGGEELYVDVDTPVPARTTIAPSQPKPIERGAADNKAAANSPRLKSGTFSRMFKGKPSSPLPERKGGQSHSGTMSHKAPKKNKFEERWAVVDGNFLIIYKNSSAKSHQEKLPLSECGLDMGSPDVGPGDHAFRITARGDRVHHFKVKAKLDFDKWVTIIKGLTKYAPIETVERGEQQVYQAQEDHIGESAGELTFKKGTYIRLISKDADNEWVGQIGNEAQVFEGKIGKFPMDKVSLAEDLYI